MTTVPNGSACVIAHHLRPAGAIPNHPHWPLLVYPCAVTVTDSDLAAAFEQLFSNNGWPAAWRDGVFPFQHFHSNAHEVLGIYSGEVTVQFGGDGGTVLTGRPGDVFVLPAGTGHKKLSSRGTLGVVGAYPAGQTADLHTPGPADRPRASDAITAVPLPERDPVYGTDGPLFMHWKVERRATRRLRASK